MTIPISSTTIEKALNIAMVSEAESVKIYQKLKGMVKNFVLRDKLQFLISEEKKHQQILEALFRKVCPGKEPTTYEECKMPRIAIALKENISVPKLMKLALDNEKRSHDYYNYLSDEVEGKENQEILHYLSHMEQGHFSWLEGEWELCKRDQMYYERKEFKYKMLQINP